jgi:tetratricopeptide (TPR) repeat protein
VQIFLMRAAKSAASAAALAVALASPALVSSSFAQAPAGGQQPAQGGQKQQQGKNWKDRAEYDLYNSIAHEQDLKKRLDLLDQWTQKYPKTDFEDLRVQAYLGTLGPLSQKDPSVRPKTIEYCKKVLSTDSKNFTALYWLAMDAPAAGGASPTPEQISDAETAGNGLLNAEKPAATAQADWDKAKPQVEALAHGALGWAASAKKDYPTAQKEYEAYLKANPNNSNISYQLGQTLLLEKKPELYPQALWSFARAASYEGPGALPAGNRTQVQAYFKKIYDQYKGNDEGADQLLAQAKTSPLPPAGFKIESAVEKQNQVTEQLNQRIQSDPAFSLWYSLQQSLTGDQGEQFFTGNVKDADIPGGANGVKNFTGTVISMDPPERPTKLVLGVQDPTKPDATLNFQDPLPAGAVKVGDKLEFSGVGESFTKEPYMLTFKDAELPGVKTVKAPTKRGTRRQVKVKPK